MKLRNTREHLANNVKVWRANVLKGLQSARPKDAETLKRLIADLVLIEIALQRPDLQEIEVEYKFPEASKLARPVAPRRSPAGLWLPPTGR